MDLGGRRLVIVAGKGGVGKTTCSAAIALELAASGRKTLLVTVDPAKRLEDSLGVPVGAAATPVQPRLWAMMLDPEAVIREHMAQRVPQAKVVDHPLFKQVARAMPGLNEMMAIGKLNDLRRAGEWDAIVVDTAPTGHALSFLGAPKLVEEVLREGSLVRWAVRGYAVWQKLSGTARTVQNLFSSDKQRAVPAIDFERVFADMEAEAKRIRAFLSDPEQAALVLVTIPEKLPVEETADLHASVTALGMRVHTVVVNKVQPDPLGETGHLLASWRLPERQAFVQKTAAATGAPTDLVQGLLDAAAFNAARRAMNLGYIDELQQRLPHLPLVVVPLMVQDVQGLKRLAGLRKELFAAANQRPATATAHAAR